MLTRVLDVSATGPQLLFLQAGRPVAAAVMGLCHGRLMQPFQGDRYPFPQGPIQTDSAWAPILPTPA